MELTNSQYKKSEVGLIPYDWNVQKLSAISMEIGDGIHTTPSYVNDSEFYFINGNNLDNGTIKCYNETKCVSKEEYELLKKNLNNNTILMSINGTIGNLAFFNNEKVVLGKSAAYINLKDKVDKKFIYFLLQHSSIKNYYENELTGTTIRNLSLKSIRETPMPLPQTKDEQTAIATALYNIDALIENLVKLIAKKRNIKRGTMQEFLTGRKRLDGFNGKWEEKRLGEILKLQGGYAFKSEQFQDNGISIVRISNIDNNTVDLNEVVYYPEFDIPVEFIIKKGDVLIAMSGATTGKIGIYQLPFYSYQNQRVGKFVLINAKTNDLNYISHLVNSEKFKSSLQKEIAQGAQPNISGKQIESIVLDIPTDIKEQTAIANILSSMDSEIEVLEDKTYKCRMIKQGMMQALLTGKIRLS